MHKNVTEMSVTEYQSPQCTLLDITAEGVLCSSPIFGNEGYDDPIIYPNEGWN